MNQNKRNKENNLFILLLLLVPHNLQENELQHCQSPGLNVPVELNLLMEL